MIVISNCQLMTSEHRPIFAMDAKTGGDYGALLRGMGQVILYNAYLANELVSKTQDKDIINDLYYPGVLFFNPFAIFFETKFNWNYLRALTASNPDRYNLSKLTPQEFPQTKVFSSKFCSNTPKISLQHEDEFNKKCKVQGFNLCMKQELVQAVMMMRQFTFGYNNDGKFDNMKLLSPFEAYSVPLPKSIKSDILN